MSKRNADAVVAIIRNQPMPAKGWNARTLSKATGLSATDFQAAVRALRYSGRMAFDGYGLSTSMLAQAEAMALPPPPKDEPNVADVVKAEAALAGKRRAVARSNRTGGGRADVDLGGSHTVQDVADGVKAEAALAGQRRASARSTGTVVRRGQVELSVGGAVQDIAIRDDAGCAVSILQGRWPDLWAGIRACAIAQGERPVSTMLRLIEAGLKVEGRSL